MINNKFSLSTFNRFDISSTFIRMTFIRQICPYTNIICLQKLARSTRTMASASSENIESTENAKENECSEKKVFYLRAKYGNQPCQIIQFDKLCSEAFLKAAAKKFNIREDLSDKVKLVDNLGALILPAVFNKVVLDFRLTDYYFLDIQFKIQEDLDKMITPMRLKQHLIDCNADSILHAESVAPIDNRAREKVIGLSVGLLTRLYGDYPSKTQKETLAQCLVTLFPSFASVKTGGFEKVYNVANGGWVGQRLKNHRRAKKSDSDSADQQLVKTIDVTEELEFLRSCVITNDSSNIGRMKTALQRTFVYRQHLIKEKKQMDLVREFSFFFTNAEWLLFDYEQNLPNSKAFIETWIEFGNGLNTLLIEKYSNLGFMTMYGEEINNLLILLRLLPHKGKSTQRESFKGSIKKLIVFRKTGTPKAELVEKNNNFPYMIAIGDSEDAIDHYYIDVEQHLMNVPTNFTFIQAFDLFFKIHKCFDLNFDPNIKPMMTFIDIYVYKLTGLTATNQMMHIFDQLKISLP